jgi:hypothetical protein
VCVCAFSLRRESPNTILGDKTLISEVVLSHLLCWRMSELAGGVALRGYVRRLGFLDLRWWWGGFGLSASWAMRDSWVLVVVLRLSANVGSIVSVTSSGCSRALNTVGAKCWDKQPEAVYSWTRRCVTWFEGMGQWREMAITTPQAFHQCAPGRLFIGVVTHGHYNVRYAPVHLP